MRAASARFAEAVLGSHRIVTRLEVWRGPDMLLDDVPTAEGEVTVDGENQIPGELAITVPAGEGRYLVPRDPFDPLAPFGQRIHVAHGIRYLDDTDELLDLGWWQIESADPDYLAGGLRVTARPLEQILEDARLMQPRQPPPGATFMSELETLVGPRLPVAEDLPAGVTNRAIPAGRLWEGNRLEALSTLAAAWPARLRVDNQGVLRVLAPADELPRTVVLTLSTGEQGVVARWDAPTSRAEIYNAVFARGEEESADARAVAGYAYDSDPASPTFYGGPFGERPMEYASPLLTTTAAASKAARTLLARRLRRTRTVTVELAPDPRIELDDYVRVETPEVRGVGRVASIRTPLGPGTMTLGLDDVEEDT